MVLTKLNHFLDNIIYDPVNGRILYDLTICLMSTVAIFFTLAYFKLPVTNFFIPIYYSLALLLINIVFGLYGKYKTSSFSRKLIIIFGSNFIAYLLFLTIFNNYLLFTLFFTSSFTITILPRFFLNFNVERITLKRVSVNNKENPILIVGGGGYIGSVLVEKLLKKGEKVRVFDKFVYSKDVFKKIKNSNNLEIMEGDISDIYSLTLAVKDSKAIVHLAGIVGDPAAKLDEDLTRHVNIASTRLLKETAKSFGIKKFIFASSCSVYGATNKLQNETSKPNPISLYANTKVDSEKELLSDRADNFHPVILRFATVFGHSRKPRFDLVANLFVAEAFNNRLIKVYGGEQWRPFIHVTDIAEAIIKVLEAPEEIVSRQIFNVGDDAMNIRIDNLATTVKEIIGDPKIKIEIIKNQKDNRSYRVSFKKINTVLGFTSSISLEKGVKEIYKNFLTKKYKKNYKNSYYVNYEMTKQLRKEFRTKKYRKSHFSTIS